MEEKTFSLAKAARSDPATARLGILAAGPERADEGGGRRRGGSTPSDLPSPGLSFFSAEGVGGRRKRDLDAHLLRFLPRRGSAAALSQRSRGLGERPGGKELLARPFDRDLAADQFLDRVEREDVVVASKGHSGPFRTGATGPSRTVDVVFGVLRKVIVDDVRDPFDVE